MANRGPAARVALALTATQAPATSVSFLNEPADASRATYLARKQQAQTFDAPATGALTSVTLQLAFNASTSQGYDASVSILEYRTGVDTGILPMQKLATQTLAMLHGSAYPRRPLSAEADAWRAVSGRDGCSGSVSAASCADRATLLRHGSLQPGASPVRGGRPPLDRARSTVDRDRR